MVKKLDILLITRGILALLVLLWHVEGYKGSFSELLNLPGRTAVILFFGMSGYVISHGFIYEKYSFKISDLLIFYQKRLLRIMPLFLLVSLITLIFRYQIKGEWLLSTDKILPELFMIQFNHHYPLNGVFWTLGIELQFYLIAPLLVYFTKHYLNNLYKQLFAYVLLFGMFIILTSIYGVDSRNLIGNLFHFFSGIICCNYIRENGVPKINNKVLIFIFLTLIAITNILYHISGVVYFTIGLILVNLCLPLLVILHQNLYKIQLNDSLNVGSNFLTLGTISYGIYAWHPLIIELMREYENLYLSLIVIITIVVSYFSYVFFEKPISSYVRKKK